MFGLLAAVLDALIGAFRPCAQLVAETLRCASSSRCSDEKKLVRDLFRWTARSGSCSRALIVRVANDNPRWSRRRIANELAMLGYRVDKNTVANYMPQLADRPRRPRSQTWGGTFVRNHLHGNLAIDFFTVPTVRFEILYVFACSHLSVVGSFTST